MQTLERHQLVEVFASRIETWGKEMLYVDDLVLDVEVSSVGGQKMGFVAVDMYGDVQAAVTLGLHFIEDFTTESQLYEFLMGEVYDALADSYDRDGRAVILT